MRLQTLPSTLRSAWRELPTRIRRHSWGFVACTVAQRAPAMIPAFLQATADLGMQPAWLLVDFLEAFANRYLRSHLADSALAARLLLSTLEIVLDRRDAKFVTLTQRTIFLILSRLDEDMLSSLWDLLVRRNISLHCDTLIQFAYHMAKRGYFEDALVALDRAVRQVGTRGDSPSTRSKVFLSVCTVILRCSVLKSGGYRANPELVSRLLAMGFAFDLVIYNVIMLNAIEAGDQEIVWSVYDLLQQNDVTPNAHTFAILLKSINNDPGPRQERFRKVLAECSENPAVFDNDIVVVELLRYMSLQLNHKHPSLPFEQQLEHLVKTYRQFLSDEPLVELGLLPCRSALPESSDVSHKKNPSPQALFIVLASHLRGISNPQVVRTLYERYCNLVKSGHPVISKLSSTPHACSAFVQAFGRHKENLPFALRVIQDMAPYTAKAKTTEAQKSASSEDWLRFADIELRNASQERQQTKPDSLPDEAPEASFIHTASPNEYTWSILAHAFMNHQQPLAAEKVLNLMRSRGLMPSRVTWNAVLGGYARLQDIDGVLSTLRRMERETVGGDDEELKLDAWDHRRLRRIVNYRALQRALEEDEIGLRVARAREV